MRASGPYFTFLICLFFVALHAQETYNLEFRYQPGRTYHYRTADAVETQQDMDGQAIKLTGRNNSLLKMEVDSVMPDSSLAVIISYEEMQTIVKSAQLDTVIDEQAVIGKRTRFILSRRGVETGRQRLDTADDSRSKSLLTMSSGQNVSFFQLPGRQIGTGEKWTAKLNDSTDCGEG
jgi:hypothetical protein